MQAWLRGHGAADLEQHSANAVIIITTPTVAV